MFYPDAIFTKYLFEFPYNSIGIVSFEFNFYGKVKTNKSEDQF